MRRDSDREGTKGHLDLLLLGALAPCPGHGYAIIMALKQRSDGALDLPEGSVYPALHRLQDMGLVASDWTLVEGRRRREYRLTPKGVKVLASERAEWSRLSAAINAVLAAAAPRLVAP
jgi:PadR family transcriptional regulator, regulatory protein PadR